MWQVICDGQQLQVPHDIEGILLLNISSYMGGANLWASGRPLPNSSLPEDATQSHADGRLEVCAWLPSLANASHLSHSPVRGPSKTATRHASS